MVFSKLFFFLQNKNPITRTKRRARQLVKSNNFSYDQLLLSSVLLSFLPEKQLNCVTKLIPILTRQYWIILTALKENIFSVLGSVASRLCRIRKIFSSK